MIIDLATQDVNTSLTTDVLVIGSGIAGLLLAAKLRDHQVRVVVLESGEREQTEDDHPFNHVVQSGDEYRGATHGRFRCLGGTSTRWGGALIPFLQQDLAARPHINLSAWPVAIEAVQPHLTHIESKFGIATGSYEEDFIHKIGARKDVPTGDSDFIARFAKWPKFKHRNVATLLKDRIECDPNFSVWINATATSFDLAETADRLRSVTARHTSGRSVTVAAAHFVVCAGAIESTRLLLLLDRQYQGKVFKNCGALGCFFHDHLGLSVAEIVPRDVIRLNRMAGFRFVGATMRRLRFELSPDAQADEGTGSAWGHIVLWTDRRTGYDVLRDFLRSLQQCGRIRPGLALGLLQDLPYLTRVGFWRYVHNQLFWPSPARYELHVIAEQLPRRDNQITLSAEKDVFGLPLAAINWRVGQSDCRPFQAYMRRFDSFWKRHGLERIGDLRWLVNPDVSMISDLSRGNDISHPGGSTRMGTAEKFAVVDQNLRTFAVSNLWVSSTSVFPSGASSNPTLMLMLFTMRLGDHLVAIMEA